MKKNYLFLFVALAAGLYLWFKRHKGYSPAIPVQAYLSYDGTINYISPSIDVQANADPVETIPVETGWVI